MNFGSAPQALMDSNSPFSVAPRSTTSGSPQNATENGKSGNESKLTLSEDSYSTLDDSVCDVHHGNHAQAVGTCPGDTSISSFGQCEPIFKVHRMKVFNDEVTALHQRTGGVPHTERPEWPSHVCRYAEDGNVREGSFQEEHLLETSTPTKEDQLAHEYVSQPPGSPPVAHCNRERLTFMVAVSSKAVQNSGEILETSVIHQKGVAVEGPESPGTVSAQSLAGTSWSSQPSPKDCKTPDTKRSLESLQPPEEDMALNEVVQKLKHTNRKRQARIQNLQRSNRCLEKRVEELQAKTNKQRVLLDTINQLKEKVEELIEDKYRVMLEKSEMDRTLQNVHNILTTTQKQLQESKKEQETLQVELKRMKGNYVCLQERYMTEMQQKDRTLSQSIELGKALSKKEDEVERLQRVNGELEKATTSALDLLKREKETREQDFRSLQEEFLKREKESLKERQELKCTLKTLVAQFQNLQSVSGSERAENTNLEQPSHEVKSGNVKVQLQFARSEELRPVPKFETAPLKGHVEELMESDVTKDISNPPAEHCEESEEVRVPMLQKQKSFHLKKKNLEEEISKHKDRIASFRELIANEKACQGQATDVTDCGSNAAESVSSVPAFLGVTLEKCHSLHEELNISITKLGNLLESKEEDCRRLAEENDRCQRHLGNLINKVTSYEEIIECADQRLNISHSHIAHLEERNKYLEDLMRRPRTRTRKPRARLENHPGSETMMSTLLEGTSNDINKAGLKIKH